MRSADIFQYTLIILGVIATVLFGIFFYRELFPEYRIYQDDYVALEDFRSSYSHEAPPAFKYGIKQIVLEKADKGNPVIDRCTTCHVALQIEAFSPTRIAKDINGNIRYDNFGVPVKEENPDYIWKRIKDDPAYEELKTAHVGDHDYDVEKVLQMHPLMGRETRPFEFHPIEEYGCTSCHGGNGRGLVTDRAHGPVFDDQYEKEDEGFVPQFLEKDEKNDPQFAHVFNSKPGHRLLFQTTPILVGALIQAKCAVCHQSSKEAVNSSASTANAILSQKEKEISAIEKGLQLEEQDITSLLALKRLLQEKGFTETRTIIEKKSEDYTLPAEEQQAYSAQYRKMLLKGDKKFISEIDHRLLSSLGSEELVQQFLKDPEKKFQDVAIGTLGEKNHALKQAQELKKHIEEVSSQFGNVANINELQTDVDLLTKDYERGQALFVSQACYACHRIAGFSRGGVGPELTREGDMYPWYIKKHIVWPQGELKTSTMPNMRLDHEELESLVTYLLGQTSQNKVLSETAYKTAIQAWEAGKKRPWEEPISEDQIQNLRYGMTVFALEGCASCHRLKGYDSDVGFALDKDDERKWFQNLFPEGITGSQIVQTIEKNSAEIDKRIVDNVRKGSIIEEIEAKDPQALEVLYSPFKYALRAKKEDDWKARVRRVLKMYVQTYGLGRLICPRPNWAGVYRSDQWLMEHFRSPSAFVPRSIMPAFPFDDTKFYALTHMLDVLGKKNTEENHQSWKQNGFNPEIAYQKYCSQCHGENLQGNGPVSDWIYPIPKNLRNPDFLRNLTKTQVFESIKHGVKGTPMPPWGEVGLNKDSPVLSDEEIHKLVDWIFATLPGATVIKTGQEVPKWHYTTANVIEELKGEGTILSDDNIFDVVGNKNYYIKKKFYTKENLQEGERFFIENCAACHGKEGDGAGLRAEAMSEAKPRMFINVDWANSRDDLRLLRSIKFGVPGTAMTPWGDFTSGLQRLQLVMFIRSLSETAKERRMVLDALFGAFQGNNNKKAKELFYGMGMGLLNLGVNEEILDKFIELVKGLKQPQYQTLKSQLLKLMDNEIQSLEKKKIAITGKISSHEKQQDLNQINALIGSWTKEKNRMISNLAEFERIKQ